MKTHSRSLCSEIVLLYVVIDPDVFEFLLRKAARSHGSCYFISGMQNVLVILDILVSLLIQLR